MANKIKLIAELCQNHNGDIDLLRRMIDDAADGGATHIKIQHIHADRLVYRSCFEEGDTKDSKVLCIKRPYASEYSRLKSLELPEKTYKEFVAHVESLGLIPLTTCFTRDSISQIAEQGFREVKVASYDCASYQMIRELCRSFNTLYVSTGATFDNEIKNTADILEKNNVHHCLLHCVTIYPTNIDMLNLARIAFLKELAPIVGYSDHTETSKDGVMASLAAIYLGAEVIERHFTVLGDKETRDGRVSIHKDHLREILNFSELAKADQQTVLHERMHDWEVHMMGYAQRCLSREELLNRHYYRGRFGSLRNGYENSEIGTIFNWDEIAL